MTPSPTDKQDNKKGINILTEYVNGRAETWHVDEDGNKLTLLKSVDYPTTKPPYVEMEIK
jgi:hypothetical protein